MISMTPIVTPKKKGFNLIGLNEDRAFAKWTRQFLGENLATAPEITTTADIKKKGH